MKHNIETVAELQPDYLGVIFYDKSPRNFTGKIPLIPESIQKVGVFVNAPVSFIVEKINRHKIQVVQLHGDESEAFCLELKIKVPGIELWKVFRVGDDFEFKQLNAYNSVDKFLFDTKGKNHGGNGLKFNWKILENYNSEKGLILSGGISIDDLPEIRNLKSALLQLEIIDINSRFESGPGIKNPELIKVFIEQLKIG